MKPSPLRWAALPVLLLGCRLPDSEEGVPPGLEAREVDCGTATPDSIVSMAKLRFDPSDVTVPDGGVIQWINEDAVAHTVTSGNPGSDSAGELFDSGNLNVGEEYCLELEGQGTLEYYCIIHPVLMQGATITITPSDQAEEPGQGPGEAPPG
jgi:plastocyanin